MKITVMVADGQTVPLDIDPDESVEKVKAVLESMTSVATQQQRLWYSGVEIKDYEKLSCLGVRHGHVIEMVAGPDSSALTSGLGFNPNGSAVNFAALQRQMQHDSDMMNQLFQADLALAQSLSINDLNGETSQQNNHQISESSYGQGVELALLPADPLGVEAEKKLEATTHQVMLYGDMEVNGIPIKAIVDTGAEFTMMSKSCAERCGLLTLMEEQSKGLGCKVDPAEILGRIQLADIKIGDVFYPCSFTVVDSTNMEFLFGLDMLRKHQCVIDLKENVLRVGGGEVSLPFSAERDIVSHILYKDWNSKQASGPGPSLCQDTSGGKEKNVQSGSQSAGEAVPGDAQQVSFGSPDLRPPPANIKGYGLKKWRRRKREIPKDAIPHLDSTTGLKRNFTNNDFPVDRIQKSEGSVSSSNAFVKNLSGEGGSFHIAEPENPAYKLADVTTFSPGTDSDNSEDRSSRSSTAASAPKFRHDTSKLSGHNLRDKLKAKYSFPKHLVGNTNSPNQSFQEVMTGQFDSSKKPRGAHVFMKKENSQSSLESDSRSSNTMFPQEGTSYVYGLGERTTGYNGEYSEHCLTEGLASGLSKLNVKDGEEILPQVDAGLAVGGGGGENHQITDSMDPLVNCVQMLQSAQNALSKEIQKFGELGKNLNTLGGDDSINSSDLYSTEDVGQIVTVDALNAKLIESTQKAEILEKQVEEAKAKLKEKESMISKLEQSITEQKRVSEIEAELESLFKQKIEAEVEFLSIRDSTIVARNIVKIFAEQISLARTEAQMLRTVGNLDSKTKTLKEEITGSEETRRMQKRVFKSISYLFVQLIVIVPAFKLFMMDWYPKASVVIPT